MSVRKNKEDDESLDEADAPDTLLDVFHMRESSTSCPLPPHLSPNCTMMPDRQRPGQTGRLNWQCVRSGNQSLFVFFPNSKLLLPGFWGSGRKNWQKTTTTPRMHFSSRHPIRELQILCRNSNELSAVWISLGSIQQPWRQMWAF